MAALRALTLVLACILIPWSSSAQGEAKLREGDSLKLLFRGIPDAEQKSLNGSYRIDDNGLIKLPYLEPFKVAGRTPSSGEREIERRYIAAEIFADPAVTIDAGNPIVRTVTVMGEVGAQGAVPYDDKLTAIAAIGAARGFSDFANRRSVKLVRGESSFELDLRSAGGKHARTKLLPGDVIVVRLGGLRDR